MELNSKLRQEHDLYKQNKEEELMHLTKELEDFRL